VSGRRGDGAGVEFVECVLSLRGVRGVPVLDLLGVEMGLPMLLAAAASASTKMVKLGLRFLLRNV
jgi:hypothetical protein